MTMLVLVTGGVGRTQDSLHMSIRSVYGPAGMRDIWGYESNGKEYALVCLGDRLEIVNCTDPDNVFLVHTVPSTSGDLKDVKVYQNFAYAVNQFGPIQIINMANPAAAFTQAHFSSPAVPSAHNIFIDEDQGFAYVTLNGSGARDMRILDLSTPTSPIEVGGYAHPNTSIGFREAHDAYARNDTAWVSYLDAGFAILDVSNKAAPSPIALVSYPQSTNHNIWVGNDGQVVYTTDERSGGHLRVWDTQDSRDIRQVAAYQAPLAPSVHNVHINGDFAFISYYVAGVRILDIEDPRDPIEVAYYDTFNGGGTFSGCWGVYPYTSSGIIYATDRTNGLFVLDWDSTRAGRVQGVVTSLHNGQPASDVKVSRLSLGRSKITGADGTYDWRVGSREDTLVFSRPGFVVETLVVAGSLGVTQIMDVALTPLPTARVAGIVTDVGGIPIANASVGVMGEDLFDVVTNVSGLFELDFVLADSDQVIVAGRWGYKFDSVRVHIVPGGVDSVSFELARGYQDHFELDLGWTVGAADDGATAGLWERVNPVGTYNFANYLTQPEDDYDAGPATKCYITGQAAVGDQVTVSDVDNGHTSLVSPFMDLTGIDSAVITFKYWNVNNAGANPNRDTIWFEVSSDTGQTWLDIGSTRFSLNAWWTFSRNLASTQLLPQPLLFRIRAVDSPDESIVEVGIDAFEITGIYPEGARGDIDHSGTVTAADIIYLVNFVFKAGPAPVAPETGDMNASCTVTASDIVWLVNFVFKGGTAPLLPCTP